MATVDFETVEKQALGLSADDRARLARELQFLAPVAQPPASGSSGRTRTRTVRMVFSPVCSTSKS